MKSLKTKGTVMPRIILALLLLVAAGSARADYTVGPGDVLQISFWQDPSLNAEVKVGEDGKIAIDIIGQIEAAGRTTADLQSEIVRLMSRLNKNISQATVRVIEYNYNHVFVIGQVNNPGKLAFEEIPDLWTLINEAGGVTDIGDLTRVTIIRGGDRAGQVEVVNVSSALSSGNLESLPRIRRQDTIEIGRTVGQVLAGEVGASIERKNIIYVVGAVGEPGPISYETNIDVMEAVALAGGPTEAADLKRTRLLLKDGNYAQSVNLNLKEYSETGRPARYIMQKEDMVLVPYQREGFFDTTVGRVATVLATVSTVYLIVDRSRSD